jgi:hypothetical protein
MAFAVEFGCGSWRVVVEDDDRACYAYLATAESLVSDVWLCNRVAPDVAEWTKPDARDLMPFLNPAPFVDLDGLGIRSIDPNELSVRWDACEPELAIATILEGTTRYAVLDSREKPGRCVLAVASGPLAVPLQP